MTSTTVYNSSNKLYKFIVYFIMSLYAMFVNLNAAPERRMELVHDKPGMDSVNVTCTSVGLYPEPRIAMYQEPFTPRIR